MKYFWVILFFIIPYYSFSQLNVTIKTTPKPLSGHTDTLSVCSDTEVCFKAEVRYAADSSLVADTALVYKWYLGDGTSSDLDSITNTYPQKGAYFVHLQVTDTIKKMTGETIMTVRVSLEPKFTDTQAEIETESVCMGEEILLKGIAQSDEFEYKLNDTKTENSPRVFDSSFAYKSTIYFGAFPVGATIDSVQQIKSIGVDLEHSHYEDLTIKLSCPNGNEVLLKKRNISTDTSFLGLPVLDTAQVTGTNLIGTTYFYQWGHQPQQTITLTSMAQKTDTLPSGIYPFEYSINNLVGCPLNGEWTIEIIDSLNANNGYVSGWQLAIDDTIVPKWKFSHQYQTMYDSSGYWLGDTMLNDPGWNIDNIEKKLTTLQSAQTTEEGDNLYRFIVVDNFGCQYDTNIYVNVSRIEIQSEQQDFTLPDDREKIKFSCQTQWVNTYEWTFDNVVPNEYTQEVQPVILQKGEYTIGLTGTSQEGCEDTTSLKITIKYEEPQANFQEVNVFTPNGDGVNDNLTLLIKSVQEVDVRIYDRWGRVVWKYKSDEVIFEEQQITWDGKNGTRYIATGVYFYTIYAVGLDGKTKIGEREKGSLFGLRKDENQTNNENATEQTKAYGYIHVFR